tara:strand:- start:2657 stop:2854 length:198 start_codon:yes stop_codon:yes gene_type:complete
VGVGLRVEDLNLAARLEAIDQPVVAVYVVIASLPVCFELLGVYDLLKQLLGTLLGQLGAALSLLA